MRQEPFVIRFPELDKKEANLSAQNLAAELRELGVAKAEQQRDNVEAQDFGATVILVLGTSSITAVAKGLAIWVKRNSGTIIEITKADGTRVFASNLDSVDASRIVQALSDSPT